MISLFKRLVCKVELLFTFHLNCKYHPWGLINDMQMSIYNRKHWHALSHSLHFVRHEGRLVTIQWNTTYSLNGGRRVRFLSTGCRTGSYSGVL